MARRAVRDRRGEAALRLWRLALDLVPSPGDIDGAAALSLANAALTGRSAPENEDEVDQAFLLAGDYQDRAASHLRLVAEASGMERALAEMQAAKAKVAPAAERLKAARNKAEGMRGRGKPDRPEVLEAIREAAQAEADLEVVQREFLGARGRWAVLSRAWNDALATIPPQVPRPDAMTPPDFSAIEQVPASGKPTPPT